MTDKQRRRATLPLLLVALGLAVAALLQQYILRHPLWRYPPSQVQVYLLAGQSNMAGRGFVAKQEVPAGAGIWQVDAQARVAPARHPLHFDKPSAGFGMGIPFAERMRDRCGDCAILLVPAAIGGTSIADWQAGGFAFERAIAMTRIALEHGELKGVLWHQGETEAHTLSDGDAAAYAQALAGAVADLRARLGAPQVPWIAGTLGNRLAGSGRYPGLATVNRAIFAAGEAIPNFVVVDTSDLDDLGDRVHFSTPALREMGRRYAQAVIHLQRPGAPSVPTASARAEAPAPAPRPTIPGGPAS